jgi:hypothetical protein
MQLISAALFTIAMLFAASELNGPLHAYLDPGTGSIALQLIIGGVVAAIATVRLYWDRLKQLVQRTPSRADTTREEQ